MNQSEFNIGEPLGYFITWTVYGTWLPGDERGWQRKGDSEPQLSNELFQEMAQEAMKETAYFLTPVDRNTVAATVTRHCEIRQWKLYTVDARSNHVHVVVTAPGYKPETVRDQFKAWCTKELKVNYQDQKRFWAEGGSRRWLNTQQSLDGAIEYVNDARDRKGLEE